MFGSVTLARNESHIERNEMRLERNETRLARNETRGDNLLLSGTVDLFCFLSGECLVCQWCNTVNSL